MVDTEEKRPNKFQNLEDCLQDLITNNDGDKCLRLHKNTEEENDNIDNLGNGCTFVDGDFDYETQQMADHNKLRHFVSEFSEADCGEPMFGQHLTMDFTPVVGVDDNDDLRQKCVDFWKFLCGQPQLGKLFISLRKEGAKEKIKTECFSSDSLEESKNTSATNWLDAQVGQPLVFATKHATRYCDVDGQDSSEINERRSRGRKKHEQDNIKRNFTFLPNITEEASEASTKKSLQSAADLCIQLKDWDQKHPQCMDPPGRVPNLCHAFLQRTTQER